MNILENIIYGILSGFSEFLPISALGHQELLKIFFGASSPEPVRDIFVHIAFFAAVFVGCGTYIEKLRRELQQNRSLKSRRVHQRDRRAYYDVTLLKSIAIIMIIGMILFRILLRSAPSLNWIAFGFLLNGILIIIPEYLPHGNKDSRKMTGFDSLLLGIGSALSVFAGFSRSGICLAGAVSRGAEKVKAYNWILVLTVPYVLVLLVFDIVVIFEVGIGIASFTAFLGYILSGIFAFASSLTGIYLMRSMLVRSSLTAFGLYSFGAALLSFLLYLLV